MYQAATYSLLFTTVLPEMKLVEVRGQIGSLAVIVTRGWLLIVITKTRRM